MVYPIHLPGPSLIQNEAIFSAPTSNANHASNMVGEGIQLDQSKDLVDWVPKRSFLSPKISKTVMAIRFLVVIQC